MLTAALHKDRFLVLCYFFFLLMIVLQEFCTIDVHVSKPLNRVKLFQRFDSPDKGCHVYGKNMSARCWLKIKKNC